MPGMPVKLNEAAPPVQTPGLRRAADGSLWCDGVRLAAVAESFGTPCYVYSKAKILERYGAYEAAFGSGKHLVCYAVKANSAVGVLEALAAAGSGFDTVSGGEILRALEAGASPEKIVFSGVGKSERDIALALFAGIRCFNIESPEELERLSAIARDCGRRARIAVRVNPDVDAHVDEHVATGVGTSKFGVDKDDVPALYLRARELGNIDISGISCHIGSQIESIEPYLEMIGILSGIAEKLAREGIQLDHVDLGGGAGVAYRAGERTLEPRDVIPTLDAEARRRFGPGIEVMVEPGRSIVAEAGALLTRCEFVKTARGGVRFAIVDASMTELLRPALYRAHHEIERAEPTAAAPELVNVAGPVCESSDVLAKNRLLAVAPDDLLVIRNAGAYGMTMASNYNSRPLPMEVLVDGSRMIPLRKRRQTALDLVHADVRLGLAPHPAVSPESVEQLAEAAERYAAAGRRHRAGSPKE